MTVHEIYSERQPCGPADSDCEGMLMKRYPGARTTFGYGYQETEAPARDSRAARTKSNIAAAHQPCGKRPKEKSEHDQPDGNLDRHVGPGR